LKIGNINIAQPVISAPMAGISDRVYREIAREYGADIVCSEMLSSVALIYENKRTIRMSTFSDSEKPISVQLVGHDPHMMAEAAKLVENRGADIIDINAGCSVKKVLKSQDGASLLKDIPLTKDIIRSVIKAVNIPVTIKIRKVWGGSSEKTLEFAKIAQEEGISAITIHGRTPSQKFSGNADWEIIKLLKENLLIPVIGNGDIKSHEDSTNMLKSTDCDGIMIGRSAMGNPWIFSRIKGAISGKEIPSEPDYKEKINLALKHYMMMLEYRGEAVGLLEMRKHLSWYIKGLKDASRIREMICTMSDYREVIELMKLYRDTYSDE
jgi:nifR3 family TIM-barrel protein